MKLLVDMNLSPRWTGTLADAGFEAAHWSTLGANNAPDSEIMAYARANDYVVLTHDLDFSAGGVMPEVERKVRALGPTLA